LFNPINFVGNIPKLNKHISDFNEYLAFDGWNVIRKNKEITFAKAEVNISEIKNEPEIREDIFINKEFEDIIPPNLLSETISDIISKRVDEIKLCMQAKASLPKLYANCMHPKNKRGSQSLVNLSVSVWSHLDSYHKSNGLLLSKLKNHISASPTILPTNNPLCSTTHCTTAESWNKGKKSF
jgi:hypothetical protein